MKTAIAVIVFYAALVIAMGTGWVLNIIKLVGHHGDWGLIEVARCIGVIAAPLGTILGYFVG